MQVDNKRQGTRRRDRRQTTTGFKTTTSAIGINSGNTQSGQQIPSVQVVAGYHRRLVIPCGLPTMIAQPSADLVDGLSSSHKYNFNKPNHPNSSPSNFQQQQNNYRRGFTNSNQMSLFQQNRQQNPASNETTSSSISLLVWYKNDQLDTPIFVADARSSGSLRESRQVINAESLKGRAHVDDIAANLNPGQIHRQRQQHATLVIEDPQPDDSGLYTCTLEFVASPTRTNQVKVQVISPPQNMIIRDELSGELQITTGADVQSSNLHSNQHQSSSTINQPLVLGPFDEDSKLNLICTADPGQPDAGQVSWWRPIDVSETIINQHQKTTATTHNSQISSWLDFDANFMTTRTILGPSHMHAFIAFHKNAHQSSQQRVSLPYPTRLWTRIVANSSSLSSPLIGTSGGGSVPDDQIGASPTEAPNGTNQQQLKAELRLNPLKRTHLDQEFLCLAQNNKFSPPLNMTIKLNMNLKPIEVKIVNKSSCNFQPGQKTAIECHIRGSKPAPKVRWLMGDRELNSYPNNNNKTFSETIRDMSRSEAEPFSWASHLTLVPELSDHQQTLTCSAQNPNMPHEPALSDSLVMDVQYAPQLTLQFGASIRPDTMRLGADVFMDCDIKANPPSMLNDLVWLHNNQPLSANVSAGIIMSNHTLVLQKIRLEQRGIYECSSQNSVGRGISNKLELKPKFAPQCDYSRTKRVYEVSLNQPTQIDCFVLAEPSDDVSFEWKFNKSLPAIPHQAGSGSSGSPSSSSITNSEYADFKLETLSSDQINIGSPKPPITNGDNTPAEQYVSEPMKKYETNFTQSYLMFRAESMRNSAGELQCRATNSIEGQSEPCIIQVIPIEIPLPVIGCFTDSVTSNSFSILCQPSAPLDGKLPNLGKVNYILELYDDTEVGEGDHHMDEDRNENNNLKNNHDDSSLNSEDDDLDNDDDATNGLPKRSSKATPISHTYQQDKIRYPLPAPNLRQRRIKQIVSEVPSFHLDNLKPDRQYNAIVYAQCFKTRSQPTSLPAKTLQADQGLSSMASNDNVSGIELSNGISSLNSRLQGKSSFADKLISLLNVGDYITLQGKFKQSIEILLIILLCGISIALITYLITNVCASTNRSARNNSNSKTNQVNRKRNNKASRIRVQVGSAPQTTTGHKTNDYLEAAMEQKLETFDLRRPQLDSSIRLRPVSDGVDRLKLATDLMPRPHVNSSGGTGSDSSRETNTESTLITSQTTTTNATSDLTNTTTSGSSKSLLRNSLRNRTGSDLTRESLLNGFHHNKKQHSIAGTSSLIRVSSHGKQNGDSQFGFNNHERTTNGLVGGFYTPITNNQYDMTDSPSQMLVLATPASLTDSQPPDTPQCSLRSAGSDCISGHELHHHHYHHNQISSVPTRNIDQQQQQSIYVIDDDHPTNHSTLFEDRNPIQVSNQNFINNEDYDRTSEYVGCLPSNDIMRPASTTHSSGCRYLAGTPHVSFDSNYPPLISNNINCRFYNGQAASAIGNCLLPNSSSIPISLSHYAGTPDPILLASAVRRPSSRQEISQLMHEVISGSTLNKNLNVRHNLENTTNFTSGNDYVSQPISSNPIAWQCSRSLDKNTRQQQADTDPIWLADGTLTVITQTNQAIPEIPNNPTMMKTSPGSTNDRNSFSQPNIGFQSDKSESDKGPHVKFEN